MSSLPEQVQLFNPVLGHGSEQDFPQFAKFPVEIRVHIFKLSLLRERFFQLWLERDDQLVGPKDRISGNLYIVNVQGRNIHSKLLRVNRDARHAALAFYRVHIPCRHEWCGKTRSVGFLYVNPERDILRLGFLPPHAGPSVPRPNVRKPCIVDFLLDTQRRDPQRIGLEKIALPTDSARQLISEDMAVDDPECRDLFARAFSNVRHIFFVCLEQNERLCLPFDPAATPMAPWQFSRSRPLLGSNSGFTRLPRDPRPISADLQYVFPGCIMPRQYVYNWFKLLADWGCPHQDGGVEYHFLISQFSNRANVYDAPVIKMTTEFHSERGVGQMFRSIFQTATGSTGIVDRATAAKFVSSHISLRLATQPEYPDLVERLADTATLDLVENPERLPKLAIGFWVFPLEALGDLPQLGVSRDDPSRSPVRTLDMSNFPPELYLADLS
ncbi:unnamed protein product [Clonostachys byssicola]|uniref:2EXR domain-containing protein n=1 Tax=Clonostachys byssicola TaxID=160290 RepID=A0A9N9UFX7_9HYPO|nr:unnamed protein product [Clonostachys byssicola]